MAKYAMIASHICVLWINVYHGIQGVFIFIISLNYYSFLCKFYHIGLCFVHKLV